MCKGCRCARCIQRQVNVVWKGRLRLWDSNDSILFFRVLCRHHRLTDYDLTPVYQNLICLICIFIVQ